MGYLLEYNEMQGCFHSNFIFTNEDGTQRFDSEPMTNGYLPVCPVPNALDEDPRFSKLLERFAGRNVPYKDVFEIINLFVIGWVQLKTSKR